MSDDQTSAAGPRRLLDDPKLRNLLAVAREVIDPERSESPGQDRGEVDRGGPAAAATTHLRWVVAADEDGFELKNLVRRVLTSLGGEVHDLGPMISTSVDYPDYAMAVGRALRSGAAERGILVCGHGVGASVAANKVPGVRAGLCHDADSILEGVEKDDMNVLVLPVRLIRPFGIGHLVQTFHSARFTGATDHRRCLGKIRFIEALAAEPPGIWE